MSHPKLERDGDELIGLRLSCVASNGYVIVHPSLCHPLCFHWTESGQSNCTRPQLQMMSTARCIAIAMAACPRTLAACCKQVCFCDGRGLEVMTLCVCGDARIAFAVHTLFWRHHTAVSAKTVAAIQIHYDARFFRTNKFLCSRQLRATGRHPTSLLLNQNRSLKQIAVMLLLLLQALYST